MTKRMKTLAVLALAVLSASPLLAGINMWSSTGTYNLSAGMATTWTASWDGMMEFEWNVSALNTSSLGANMTATLTKTNSSGTSLFSAQIVDTKPVAASSFYGNQTTPIVFESGQKAVFTLVSSNTADTAAVGTLIVYGNWSTPRTAATGDGSNLLTGGTGANQISTSSGNISLATPTTGDGKKLMQQSGDGSWVIATGGTLNSNAGTALVAGGGGSGGTIVLNTGTLSGTAWLQMSGGSILLATDANGRIQIQTGTLTGQLDTKAGMVKTQVGGN